MTDDFFVREIERTQQEYSFAWEGLPERVVDLGEALVRADSPTYGFVLRLAFRTEDIEERLAAIRTQVERVIQRSLWIVGPGTYPVDLEQQLVLQGFTPVVEWDGLVLDNLAVQLNPPTDVYVEALSWDNLEEYAVEGSGSPDPKHHEVRRRAAHKYLEAPHPQVHICLARLRGEVVGFAKQWITSTGLANMRDAFTRPEFRRQGVYTALLAHRLELAREAGCQAAIIRAQTTTSAPILKKRGFRAVCRLAGLHRTRYVETEG